MLEFGKIHCLPQRLKECFFNYNGGLDSRFTWRFHIDNYTPDELKLIFEKKVKDANWKLQKNIKTNFLLVLMST